MALQTIFVSLLSFHLCYAVEQILAPYRHEFSCGDLFYRTLHLQQNEEALFVGGMDNVFKLDAANISRADCTKDVLILQASNVANCVSKGKSEEYDCRNHIRVIQSIGDGSRLYVCGTNAHSPKDHVVYSNLSMLARHEFYPGVGDGIAKCPFDPEDNSTALWVESGNPGGHPAIYSGTNAEFTKADTVIFRGDIFDEKTGRREYSFKRTLKYDSHMLDKPDFVGSYDIGDYVYFFFRETAVEYMNCGKTVYSRIARVCKKDVGGKNILNQNWATFLKARLNCSIPGEFPFFFNEIQDIFKSVDDDSMFHAIFTTNNNGLKGSAICSFRLQDVETSFAGKFKEQATSTSVWLPVPVARVPEPRPGTCVEDTRELPDTVLNFIRKHPMMDTDVPHDSDGPVFYRRDVLFTKVIVDRVSSATTGYGKDRTFYVYYAGTDDGKIYKISRWVDAKSGESRSRLLDIFEATSPDPVRAIQISKKNKAIYVSSDRSVQQISTELCLVRYENCVQCVRDPYCGWDRESAACRPRDFSLLQDPSGEAEGICESSIPKERIVANFGESIHLKCHLTVPQFGGIVSWHHQDSNGHSRRIRVEAKDKYVLTQEGGLVILGVSERDSGSYQCHLNKETAMSYDVTVDAHRCSAPDKTADYQKVYSEWCNQFQKYKSALKGWEKRQNKCAALTGPEVLSRQNQIYNPIV